MAVGRVGLGSFPNPRYDWAHNKENPQLVQDEICTELSEGGTLQLDVRVRGVDKVGAGGTTQTLLGEALGGCEPLRTKPTCTPGGLADTPECKLCQGLATLEHNLSGCP